ncbi:MAG: hypothetical protein JSV36_07945 [Anaerolineae bacterium]|nr:MAG: hypothetical protein JSV36_07945 [Anaerolineae bacterium]
MSPVTVPLALAAGLLSFISPCVLPLVPVYLSYLSGSSLSNDVPPSRRLVLGHALFFVGGFALAFIILFGLPATLLGSALEEYSDWIANAGGAILILFGLHTIFEVAEGVSFADLDGPRATGPDSFSASGFRTVHQWLADNGLLEQAPGQDGSCGV